MILIYFVDYVYVIKEILKKTKILLNLSGNKSSTRSFILIISS